MDLGAESQRVPGECGVGRDPEHLYTGGSPHAPRPRPVHGPPLSPGAVALRTSALALQLGPGKEVVTGRLPASVSVARLFPEGSFSLQFVP